jgi:hypothetical protein
VKGSLFLFFSFFFFLWKLRQKAKFRKLNNLEGFLLPEMKKEKVKIAKFHIFGFSLCSQRYRRMIKDLYFGYGL